SRGAVISTTRVSLEESVKSKTSFGQPVEIIYKARTLSSWPEQNRSYQWNGTWAHLDRQDAAIAGEAPYRDAPRRLDGGKTRIRTHGSYLWSSQVRHEPGFCR